MQVVDARGRKICKFILIERRRRKKTVAVVSETELEEYRDCFCKLLEGEKSENQRKTNGSIEGNS